MRRWHCPLGTRSSHSTQTWQSLDELLHDIYEDIKEHQRFLSECCARFHAQLSEATFMFRPGQSNFSRIRLQSTLAHPCLPVMHHLLPVVLGSELLAGGEALQVNRMRLG
jgi:hypothetical protein